MTTPEFKRFYQTLKGPRPAGTMTIQELRVFFEKMMSPFQAPEDVTFKPLRLKRGPCL